MATQESAVLKYPTIRHKMCELLCSGDSSGRCNQCSRYRNTQRLQQSTTKRLVRLRAKIAQSVEENGVEVDVTSHSDVKAIME